MKTAGKILLVISAWSFSVIFIFALASTPVSQDTLKIALRKTIPAFILVSLVISAALTPIAWIVLHKYEEDK